MWLGCLARIHSKRVKADAVLNVSVGIARGGWLPGFS